MDQGQAGRRTGEAFTVVTPETAGRFVFASPHSGEVYPDDMGCDPALARASLRSAEDVWVDRLIAPGADLGASLVLGRLGRAYVDLNRDPDDLDAVLIDGLAADSGGARAAAGYGVIPRLTGDGRALYARRLAREEASARLARVHAPYHAALAERMRAAHARHGGAVLIDWHSMPSRAVGGARGVDVVLGDRHGVACAPALTRRVRDLFEGLGWRVALNQPYAGGWTTQAWGRPAEGFQALQIELSRALYLDEATGEPGPGWSRCEKGVARVIAAILADG
ncbi:MAG: N-formylglutamate amidohydrolase [Brevundimonas sp.]|nr:MAG: N-formylglutamate amidohydrolase [Brevundimonas sp.]